MLISYTHDQDSIILRVKILDSSATTGAGLTGLTFSSSGLIVSTIADNEATATVYAESASNLETVTTLGTYSAPTASKARFREVDATNHPGIYEIQIADARFGVSSAKYLLVSISGATNVAECDALIPLTQVDPYDNASFGITDLPAILVDTAEIGAAGAGLTAVPWNSSWDAEVESECNDALVALSLDHLVAVADADDPVNDSIVAKLASTTGDWSTFVDTTDSLQSIRDKQTDIETDTAEIGAAGAGLTEAGGTGDHLTAIPWNSSWDAEVQSEVDDALVAQGLDHLVNASVIGTDITNNSIFARLVSSSATADWDDFVNTTDSLQAIRDKQTDIETDTAEIGAAGAGLTEAGGTGDHLTAVPWNSSWDAEVQSEVNDGLVALGLDHLVAVADADDPVNDSIVAKLASSTGDWSTFVDTTDSLQSIRDNQLSAANVNSEVVDALATDTYAELGAVPAATSSLADKLTWVFMFARNKLTQTSTTAAIRDDADGSNVATATVSDDATTFTRGEYS